MNSYQKLVAHLKVVYQDLQTLHRNLVGDSWLPTHEQLREYYELFGTLVDATAEMGLSQGVAEVSIEDAIKEYPLLRIKSRLAKESLAIAKEKISEVADQMQNLGDELEDRWITAKLDDWEYQLRIIADYKLARAVI